MIQVTLPVRRVGMGRASVSRGIAARNMRIRRMSGLADFSDVDWTQIINTGLTQAGSVAKTAVTPPMYSSVVNPLTGASSVTSYAGSPGLYPGGSSIPGIGTSLSSVLSSPIVLLGGIALLVLAFRR